MFELPIVEDVFFNDILNAMSFSVDMGRVDKDRSARTQLEPPATPRVRQLTSSCNDNKL